MSNENATYLFTSESVTEGHPDKLCDQVSDAILDAILAKEIELEKAGYISPSGKPADVSQVRCACETVATTGTVFVTGEIRTQAYVDVDTIVRDVVRSIGYDRAKYGFDCDTCGVINAIHSQSPDIAQGVDESWEAQHGEAADKEDETGAGDQGIMFGYACNETREMMPATLILSHVILKELAVIRREGEVMTYLRPDSKSQVTIEYDETTNKPLRVHTIVVSTQHDEFILPGEGRSEKEAEKQMQDKIREDVRTILIPRVKARLERAGDQLAALIGDDYILHVNPTGKFVIGGPHGDTGLTGRKIIVDTYGGRGAHGGGAFSGKDSSKVDRSAAYAARHIAKNLVAAGVADQILVELSYAIGIAQPLSIYVDTYNSPRPAALAGMTDGEIARRIGKLFDLRPAAIVKRFGLKNPIFEATASYGHFGNRPYTKVEKVWENGVETEREIEFFGWEKLDAVEQIKREFGL